MEITLTLAEEELPTEGRRVLLRGVVYLKRKRKLVNKLIGLVTADQNQFDHCS